MVPHIYNSIRSVFTLLLLLPVMVFAQVKKQGSLVTLKSTNGFNGITLGANVTQLTGSLAYLDGNSRVDADSCLRYLYTNENLLKIDSTLKLDGIGIRAYKDTIVNIYLFFRKDDAYKVMSKFLNDYGQFNEKPQQFEDIYNWNTSVLKLSLNYSSHMDMGIAVFTNNALMDKVNQARQTRDQRALAEAVAKKQASEAMNNSSQELGQSDQGTH